MDGIVNGDGQGCGSRECGRSDETFCVCGVVVQWGAAAGGAADAQASASAVSFGGVGEEGHGVFEDRVREGAEGRVAEAGW